jgi:hypothetical protein
VLITLIPLKGENQLLLQASLGKGKALAYLRGALKPLSFQSLGRFQGLDHPLKNRL